MAYEEVKKGENTQLFREVVSKIDGRLGDGFGPDPDWTEVVERKAEARKDKLENELNAYRVVIISDFHLTLISFFGVSWLIILILGY